MAFQENDSLDEFMDRILLALYGHFRGLTGNHAEAARMLHTSRVSLYRRVERARSRAQGNGTSSPEDFE
jgi:hypothetical protein